MADALQSPTAETAAEVCMSAASSRFVAIWASHEARARLWFRLFLFAAGALALSLITTVRAWNRPREVIRIGCDGIPQVVTLDNASYSEPNEREIRAFVTEFAVFYARSDSYSILNDMVWCANRMAPELRERFKKTVRAKADTPGLIAVIEKLQRRTQIDPAALEIEVDKKSYPWRSKVKGVRQVVGESATGETFELDMELVRASRDEHLEGLLVWSIRAKGDPVERVLAARTAQGAEQ
jgi:hypothetical protein